MKKIVISLGGSLIYPENIDTTFLKLFKILIEDYLEQGYQFTIICGGGKLARNFQKAVEEISDLSDVDKDWLGIYATEMNAELVKAIFQDKAHETIVSDPTEQIATKKKLIIASGWKPGWSTDYDAVLLAKNIDAHMIINMSNIDNVYDKDPKAHPDAKPLHEISWEEFRKLVGDEWSPGLNMPFDPIASKEAQKNNVQVYIVGKDLDNLRKVIDGDDFQGTIVG